ncbi:hypothetical protein AAVH_11413 [Aphelenchoides avenae]|nr:hypothetical protein AAVH_11413 [Aphelenchus avenae]
MLWCGAVVYIFIERAGKSMSEKTRYMQRQMNRLMMAEAGSVTVVGSWPTGLAMLLLIVDATCVGLGIWLTILFSWIPIVNPVYGIGT